MNEQKMNRIVRIAMIVLSLTLTFGGLCLVATQDWKIALGLFLFAWGNNIQMERK